MAEWFSRFLRHVDKNVGLPLGLAVICLLSVLTALLLATANPFGTFLRDTHIGDYYTHYAWMKITHRLPISEWFDNNGHNHFDYPHVAAYFHYLMAFVVKLFDPETFNNSPMYPDITLNTNVKYGVRISILLCDVVTYYPAVILTVLSYMGEKQRVSYKLLTVLLFLTMPMYAYIEFANTQANGPHLAFLLLTLHFTGNGRFVVAAVCFTLSLCYKHFVAPYLLPIAIYMLIKIWRESKEKSQDRCSQVARTVMECIKLALTGIATLVVSLLPMMGKPESMLAMARVLFPLRIRCFYNPAPTFWAAIKDLLTTMDTEEGRTRFLFLPYVIMVTVAVCIYIAIARREPTKRLMVAAYVTFSVGAFLFGFFVHEKHAHYIYVAMLLEPTLYKDFFTFFMLISVWSLVPITCYSGNNPHIAIYGSLILALCYLFEADMRDSESAKPAPRKTRCFFRNSIYFLVRNSRTILCLTAGVVLANYLGFVKSFATGQYKCDFTGVFDEMTFTYGFVGMLLVFYWAWMVLLFLSREKNECRYESLPEGVEKGE